ncbi:NHL repeat domain-containing protein [Naegleria gruberi]|uniref:NHL repeat domain-containing protein n=1 Tax=Naegleria gruberi TaxID=5762 RepID=D2VCD3_NAEGR|nr:NHL repeat domain-containing protein [Naegleria gruberi]EFC45632.1 NHL repeat domain-containing protein [Naegleria gruberi]|eukprot:XP_002678376.1 NHL repeat domain-containing protein [Naegleria gruberi strain NEG-M]
MSLHHLILVALLISAQFVCFSQQQATMAPSVSHMLLAGGNTPFGYYGNTKGLTPSSILCGQDDFIYSVDTSVAGIKIAKLLPSGVISSSFGTDHSSATGRTLGMASYPDGSAAGKYFVYELDPVTKILTKNSVSLNANGPVGTIPMAAEVISDPSGLAVTSNGDLLFSDSKANVIRRINMTAPGLDGNYTTTIVAGVVGASGYGGESVVATGAILSSPTGITVFGNAFYFAETSLNIIRKVDMQTGLLTTVAGIQGQSGDSGEGYLATSAFLNGPQSVAFNSNGDMFISDSKNNKIKKVFFNNGTIITIAGTGSANFTGDGSNAKFATLNLPTFISVSNSTGDIYIIDSQNYRIRKITASTNVISTFLGNGLSRNYGENISAGAASFNSPVGFTFSLAYPNNVIYVADTGNHRIRSFSQFYSGRNIVTVAGLPRPGLGGENLPALSSSFNFPSNLVFHPISGDLLIVDTQNHRIRSMSKSTSFVKTIAGTGIAGYNGEGMLSNMTKMNSPSGIAVLSTGEIIFADTFNNLVRMINLQGIVSIFSSNVSAPVGIAVNSKDEIYIGDSGNQRVLRCTKQGVCVTFAGTKGVKGYYPSSSKVAVPVSQVLFTQPTYIAPNNAGDVYVVDSGNGRIVKIARDGKAANVLNNLVNPGNIAFNEYEQSPIFISSDIVHELKSTCNSNYVLSIYDYECNLITCSGVALTNSSVCSSHGVCASMDTCICNTDDTYFGKNCEFKLCNGAQISSTQPCVAQQSPSTKEIKVETILISSLNAKNVTFDKFETIQVTFPSSIVSQLNSTGSVSGNLNIDLVSSVVNQTLDNSLNSLSENNTIFLVSSIVTISLFDRDTGKEISVKQLSEPINIQMKSISVPNSLLENREFSFVCMYLDISSNTWKTDGVETIIQNLQNTTETLTFSTLCRTTHLTSFAVIDPTYKKASKSDSNNSNLLDLGTIIGIAVGGGAGLLIVCTMMVLAIVVLVVCCVKKRK